MLKNKKVIVTGGSQGIGKGIALAMARAGADVLIQFKSSTKLAEKVCLEITDIGRQAFLLQSDFSNEKEVDSFIDSALQLLGDLDVLVNCAAAYNTKPFLNMTPADMRRMHLVNSEAPMKLIQEFAQYCIKSSKAASVVNIASISGTMPSINSTLNSCSKSSLIMLTRCAALELANNQIRVNAIAPGTIDTESNAAFKNGDPEGWSNAIKEIPLERVGLPKECGELAVFLASSQSSWITGAIIPIDGGMTISWKS